MNLNARRQRRRVAWLAGTLAALSLVIAARQPATAARAQTRGAARVQPRPRLTPGVVMRYQIEVQSTSDTSHSGAVQDPQGPSHLIVTWNATIRMEALSGNAAVSATAPPGSIRLRTTYEKSSAVVSSDTPDPQAEATEQQYDKLEGQSIEFTVLPGGGVSDVSGLSDILTDEKARSAVEQWIKQISAGVGTPTQGIIPGQTWSVDEPADTLPLAGMVWRTNSTYLQNEPCRSVDPVGTTTAQDGETCAVILTRLSLVTVRKMHDPTPDAYLKNGVHTTGHWSSSGESMNYVSLRNGWVVNVTQNGSEQMDVMFTNSSGVAVRYSGTVGTHTTVSLLPSATPAASSGSASQ